MSEGFIGGPKRMKPMLDQFGNPIDSNAELKRRVVEGMNATEPLTEALGKGLGMGRELLQKKMAPPPEMIDNGLTQQQYDEGSRKRQEVMKKLLQAEAMKNSDNMLPTTRMNQPKSEYADDLSQEDMDQLTGDTPAPKPMFGKTRKMLGK